MVYSKREAKGLAHVFIQSDSVYRTERFIFISALALLKVPSFCVCAYLGLDVDKSPSQHILDIHVSRVPPTLGHFFLTSFFFRNLFDNTVISFLDRDRQKAFLDIYQDRKVWNVSSRGRSTL